jgi:YgiT-type zinc finger domain-containing protein
MEFPPPEQRQTYPSGCSVCLGPVVPRQVALTYPGKESPTKVRVIDGVPAGVCEQCGEKYLLHEVVVKLEQLMATPPTREEAMPVWDYTGAS